MYINGERIMLELVKISPEETKQLTEAEAYLNGAKNYIIDNNDSFNRASNSLRLVKEKKKQLDEMRKILKRPILEAGKNIDELFRQPINNLTLAEQIYKKNMLTYQRNQEEKRLNEEKRSLIEQNKLKQELEKTLSAAIETGDIEKAKTLLDSTPIVDTNVYDPLPHAAGVQIKDNWKGEVHDLLLLLEAILDGKAPINLIKVDETALNSIAKSLKGAVNYPGIRFYNDKIMAIR